MDAQSGKAARRRRKPPQRRLVPAIVEQAERKPFIFGWGSDLTQRERESLKERIALLGGIVLAAIVVGLIGWGVFIDNVWQPYQDGQANNKPVATVGNYVVRTGFLKRFEQFRYNNLASQLSQAQSQLQTLNADPKKNAASIQQLQTQIGQLQAGQNSLAPDSLTEIITDQVAIQRGFVVGVRPTARAQTAANFQMEKNVGGRLHFQQFIQSSGLSQDELYMLLLGGYLQAQIQKKVTANVPHAQVEVRASHILVALKDKKLADKLFAEVKNGANFAALAKKYSIDKGSSVKGGDLGFFPKGQMVAPFEKAAFATPVGGITRAQSTFGYHIIKVTGRNQKSLTAAQYSQAQGSAFQTWLATEKAALHVQNIIAPSNLPNIATPTAIPGLVPTASQIQVPPSTSLTPRALPTVVTVRTVTTKPTPTKKGP